MANIENLRSKFLHAYANLPVPERSQVIAILNEKTYSWDTAYTEVSNKTLLGNKILKKMELLEIL